MATCPECDAEIDIDEFEVDKGEVLHCPDCGLLLEVTNTSPIELELAPDEEEDEDEEDEELDDDDDEEDEDEEDWDE